jgi:hypothetical protein
VSHFLPKDFQYLGAYAAICLVLQTFFALKLLSCFTSDRAIILVGSLFFLNSPILLNRFYGHYSLCSQWLILAALYCYFRPANRADLVRYISPFVVLAAVSGGITPYLAVMVLAIGVAGLYRSHLEAPANVPNNPPRDETSLAGAIPCAPGGTRLDLRRILAANHPVWAIILAAATVISFTFFGFIVFGSIPKLGDEGYRIYSMNLLSPFNPSGTSILTKLLPVFPVQGYEAYNYLGLGVISLGLICLIRSPGLVAKLWTPALRPLVFVSVLLTLVALSLRFSLGPYVLSAVPLPQELDHLFAIFRSGGRFFWPVHYLLTLGAIVGVVAAMRRSGTRRAMLAGALLLQFMDILPVRNSVARLIRIEHYDPLVANDWAAVAKSHRHLIVLPAWQCDQAGTPGGTGDWPWFARLAAKGGLTLNSVRAARESATSVEYNCIILPKQLIETGLRTDTAYVLGDRLALFVAERPHNSHYCRVVDGFNLCTFDPARASLSRLLGEKLLPPYVLGTTFRADRPPPKSMLMDGWDLRPSPGIWTLGKEASLCIRPTLPSTGDLRLEVELGGPGALLTARHRKQRAIVKIDGKTIGIMTFVFGGENARRSLVIPRALIHDGRVMEIALDLPDAARPSALGINGDGRLLGLYVSQIRLVGNE